MKKLTAPEPNTRYSFRMPNGNWHSFVFFGTADNGRLLFINTTYGTKTSMTPARFSFMFAKFPKTVSPYILENHYPTAAAQKQAEDMKRAEEQTRQEEEKRKNDEEKFRKLIFCLKTLPIDVEYTVNQSLNLNVRKIAEDLERENNFDMYTATAVSQIEKILSRTPYALPNF